MRVPTEVYERDNLTLSQAQVEQALDQTFNERGQQECEHLWEKVSRDVWQCEVCGDLVESYVGEEYEG